MKEFMNKFIGARFWILPLYVSAYYLQLVLPVDNTLLKVLKVVILCVLILFLVAAILANRMWTEHYRERVFGGMKYIVQHDVKVDEEVVLEQHRWAGAKLLGVVVIILGCLAQFKELPQISFQHRVPVLVTVLVILVALFDAALDLSAEQAVCLLAPTRTPDVQKTNKLIWHTNQRNALQKQMVGDLLDVNSPLLKALQSDNFTYLSYKTFSGLAQNLIALAIIIVFYISALAMFYLFQQLRAVL